MYKRHFIFAIILILFNDPAIATTRYARFIGNSGMDKVELRFEFSPDNPTHIIADGPETGVVEASYVTAITKTSLFLNDVEQFSDGSIGQTIPWPPQSSLWLVVQYTDHPFHIVGGNSNPNGDYYYGVEFSTNTDVFGSPPNFNSNIDYSIVPGDLNYASAWSGGFLENYISFQFQRVIFSSVSPIPETHTWLLLAIGIGMMGTVLRYRRRGFLLVLNNNYQVIQQTPPS